MCIRDRIYIELSSIRGNFMANIILHMIENYHFLPDMAWKLKNKQALVESVIANEQLEPSITLSIKDVYDEMCIRDSPVGYLSQNKIPAEVRKA